MVDALEDFAKNLGEDFKFREIYKLRFDKSFLEEWEPLASFIEQTLLIACRVLGGVKTTAQSKHQVKKDGLKKVKIEKCQSLIDKILSTTSMDACVNDILKIPSDKLIDKAISYLTIAQLDKVLEVEAEDIGHGERIIKRVLPSLIPLIGTMNDAMIKRESATTVLENTMMKAFVEKYYDGLLISVAFETGAGLAETAHQQHLLDDDAVLASTRCPCMARPRSP